MWLRAFHETYNPSLAPAVLALLASDIPDVSLTMIGPDKGDGSLQRTLAAAARLGVSDRLRVIEGVPKEKVGDVLSEADIFLNTTNVDNTPVSVMEAMACGLCVVSTNVGGIPDLVDDGRDGILVPPADPAAMAAGVRRVLDGPGVRGQAFRATRVARRSCSTGRSSCRNGSDCYGRSNAMVRKDDAVGAADTGLGRTKRRHAAQRLRAAPSSGSWSALPGRASMNPLFQDVYRAMPPWAQSIAASLRGYA